VKSDSVLLLPDKVGPIFSIQGDMLVAGALPNQTSLFSRILYRSRNGNFTEIAKISNPSETQQILNIFASGKNEICVVIGGPQTPNRCLVFIQTPFEPAEIKEFLFHQ